MMVMNSATGSLSQSSHYTLRICVFYQRGNIIQYNYNINFECCHLVGVNGFISMTSTATCVWIKVKVKQLLPNRVKKLNTIKHC